MRNIGIIMNGVMGRMGRNQRLKRSILAIMEDALALYCTAEQCGVKHEVVQDKLWLPGCGGFVC